MNEYVIHEEAKVVSADFVKKASRSSTVGEVCKIGHGWYGKIEMNLHLHLQYCKALRSSILEHKGVNIHTLEYPGGPQVTMWSSVLCFLHSNNTYGFIT
ncbi:hypothetical protein NPIL_302151 [Nephila pilipes]|uniref:Uncharacterized protein n=1 Tax=Nephila pilipes TaxID=299642 RepID=A0A8X6QYJ3_NEPPI|nr:hypothetical protein NPIL_302151 [Nephila pilipes]